MGNRTSGYGDSPDFSGTLSFRVQQERPESHPGGALWGVEFFIDDAPQVASKRLFATEAEARACGNAELEGRHG